MDHAPAAESDGDVVYGPVWCSVLGPQTAVTRMRVMPARFWPDVEHRLRRHGTPVWRLVLPRWKEAEPTTDIAGFGGQREAVRQLAEGDFLRVEIMIAGAR